MTFSNSKIKGWYQSPFLCVSLPHPMATVLCFLFFVFFLVLTNSNPNFDFLVTFPVLRDVKIMWKTGNHLGFTKYCTSSKRKKSCFIPGLYNAMLRRGDELSNTGLCDTSVFTSHRCVHTKKGLGKASKLKPERFCVPHWIPIELEAQLLSTALHLVTLIKRPPVFWMTPSRAYSNTKKQAFYP